MNPASGCPAIDGENRMHAILGTSPSCVATHPSDLAVALVALDASIRLQNGTEERLMKLDEFYLCRVILPTGKTNCARENSSPRFAFPALPWARKSTYLKIRDRESYEFALTSAAVALDLDGDKIRDVRIAVGGVGTKPWNLPKVREALVGKPFKAETLDSSGETGASRARTH